MTKSFYLYIDCTDPEARKFTKNLIKNCTDFSVPEHLYKCYNYFIATLDKEGHLIFRAWLKHPKQYNIIDSYTLEESDMHNFTNRLLDFCLAHSNAFKSLNEQRNFRCIKDSSIIQLINYIQNHDLTPAKIVYEKFINNTYINNLLKNSPNYETQLQRETNSQSIGEHANESRISRRRTKTQLCCYDVKPQEIHRNKKERNYRGLH